MKNIFIALIFLFLTACTSPDPNPELRDIIYIDLSKELDLTKKTIEQTEKDLADRELMAKKAVPQSGQLKGLEKKVFESKNYLQKLTQQKQFFEIKLELRKNTVGGKYHDSLHGGKPWPDPHEITNYTSSIKLNRDKIGYDKNKGVVKNVSRGTPEKPTSSKKEVED